MSGSGRRPGSCDRPVPAADHAPVHGSWEPTPAHRWEDGYLAGNGSHGALAHGDLDDDRVIVTHHRLVRPNGSERLRPPALARRLAEAQRALLAGDNEAGQRFGDGLPFHWVQPFHPALQTRVVTLAAPPGGRAGGYRRSVDFTTGEIRSAAAGRTSTVFVSRADDVIVQLLTAPGHDLAVRLDHELPGAPANLSTARSTVPIAGGAHLALRVDHPDSGRGYTVATVLLADAGGTTAEGAGTRVRDARALLLLTRVHRHDAAAGPAAPDPAELWERLVRLAAAVVPRDRTAPPPKGIAAPDARRAVAPQAVHDALLARHVARHRPAYLRVALDLHAPAAERALPGSALLARPDSTALLERLFAAGRHHLLSAAGELPPRLTGLWTGDWDTAWSGAFTTNANLNLQTASAAGAALPEVVAAQRRFIAEQLDDWRENAAAIFGTRGVVAPSHTDGDSGHTRHFQRDYPLHVWTAGADWLLLPLLHEAEHTGAPDDVLDTLLAEVAQFYDDFLLRDDGGDGTVTVVPSYSPENSPAGRGPVAVNATMDIAAARHALTTAAERLPGDDRAPGWRRLAAALPPYRVNEDGALAEWASPGLGDTYDHRHLSHLYPVWPLTEITPEAAPELAEAARRALELRGSENDSAHGHLHRALIAARLNEADTALAALRAVLHADCFHDSLMSSHYPARDVYNADAAHALPAAVLELVAHTSPGRLDLLPALPAAFPTGAVTGLATRFGSELDVAWSPRRVEAVLRPGRDAVIELRLGRHRPRPGRVELTAGCEQRLTLAR
ncbi:glycosyl hydrolase family 95 catalytic domain-containing protein [Streptomyces spiramenti]|uniref:Glycosyl hydrolase family 95 N-terminal domain-containing protein n=1 Tax=Streptomyces spiramenti TaxID=2720606 RepID=A0ABX1AV99_9ACTN|nr:glycoside hydrolase N-terminal domain-containing protein [Streptomyces spiramenti]NJP68327.1 hypothetical protein [Streptomyces spiramenti]